MVTVHKKRRKSLQGGTGSNNYIFLINASDDYTASIFDDLKTAIYRNAVEDYFRDVRRLNRMINYECLMGCFLNHKDLMIIDEIKRTEKFILSGAYNFDITTAKQIVKYMHDKCKKECPDVYEVLYRG